MEQKFQKAKDHYLSIMVFGDPYDPKLEPIVRGFETLV